MSMLILKRLVLGVNRRYLKALLATKDHVVVFTFGILSATVHSLVTVFLQQGLVLGFSLLLL